MLNNENKRVPRSLSYEAVYNAAKKLFDDDPHKTNAFWLTKQEALNNLAPYEMIKAGKARKLMRFLEKCGV